jgi:hypothetical protein
MINWKRVWKKADVVYNMGCYGGICLRKAKKSLRTVDIQNWI